MTINSNRSGVIPQGHIIFVVGSTNKSTTIIFQENIGTVATQGLKFLKDESEMLSASELKLKYHNDRRNSNKDK